MIFGVVGGCQLFGGEVEAVGGEFLADPLVEEGDDDALSDGHFGRVSGLAGVEVTEFAHVAGAFGPAFVLAGFAGQAPSAVPAVQHPPEGVVPFGGGVGGAMRGVGAGGFLGLSPLGGGDDGGDGVGHRDVAVVGASAAAGDVPGRGVGGVEQDFSFLDVPPGFRAHIAGVGTDGLERRGGPAGLAAVGVSCGVGRGGRGDAGGVETCCDGAVADVVGPPAKDLLDDGGVVGVGFEALELDAPPGFFGVGVQGAGGRELVAEGWAAAEEAGGAGHGGHAGQDPFFEAGAFAFAHGPEDVEDDVVGFGAEVDLAAYFGVPTGSRCGIPWRRRRSGIGRRCRTPAAVPDDDAVPSPVRVGHLGEEVGGLGAAVPGQGAGHVGVVHHLDDVGFAGDQAGAYGDLPAFGVFGGLVVVGGKD